MRVAILLTGLDEVFPRIKNRILSHFECEGIEFDFFGHTWEEKVSTITKSKRIPNWDDLSNSLVKKNIAFPHKDDRIKHYKTSSYLQIYNEYLCNDLNIIDTQTTLVFSYMAQDMSTFQAFQALEEYKNENNIDYDIVIKWRYDLLTDEKGKDKLINLLNMNKSKIFCPHVTNHLMDDFYYMAGYDIFKKLIDSLLEKMYKKLIDVCRNPDMNNPYIMYHERMMLECVKDIFEDSIVEKSTDIFCFHTIFRPGAKETDDFWNIHHYNKNIWCNLGWEQRVLK